MQCQVSIAYSNYSQNDCWKPANFELSGDGWKPGAVYPADANGLIGQGLVDVLPDRLQLLTVPAPRRVEHNQPHPLILQGNESTDKGVHMLLVPSVSQEFEFHPPVTEL